MNESLLSCFFKPCIREKTKSQIKRLKVIKEKVNEDFNLKNLILKVKYLLVAVEQIKNQMQISYINDPKKKDLNDESIQESIDP